MQHWYDKYGTLVKPRTVGSFPSATTILAIQDQPELHAWRLKVGLRTALRKQKESSERGKEIHKLVSDWINNNSIEAKEPEHEEMLHAYIDWEEKHKPTDIRSEIFVRSEKYKYAGTADIICRLNGDLWVIDIKTSKAFNPSYGLQLRAYEQAFFEEQGEHARMAVLQLTPDVKCKYRWKEYKEPLSVFLAMKTIFDWDLRHKPTSQDTSVFDGRFITP